MAAPKGNQFWLARSKHGRDPIFKDSNILWEACLEYFEWVSKNPLMELRGTQFQGGYVTKEFPKMRAMTIEGLCIFLDIARRTWDNYREREDFLLITTRAEEIMDTQKFTGAAADMLNHNIIARHLGLVDKQDTTVKLDLSKASDEELAQIFKQTKNQLEQSTED